MSLPMPPLATNPPQHSGGGRGESAAETPDVRFVDGNVTDVVRLGNTVRRVPGPWTPAVHALLRHLAAAGFDGAPQALGFDDQGREVLTFVEGDTIPASLEGFRTDSVLVEVARLLRRYHDSTATFVAPSEVAWQWNVGAPPDGEVVCHNDVAPWNTVLRDGLPVAFIDWDFAAPGSRDWDVAHALWRFVPLYDGDQFGTVAEKVHRMLVFCDAYGLADRRWILRTILHRLTANYASLAAWMTSGVPAFVALWRDGHADGVLKDLGHLQRHWAEFERLLGV